jgi:hypothetical protein
MGVTRGPAEVIVDDADGAQELRQLICGTVHVAERDNAFDVSPRAAPLLCRCAADREEAEREQRCACGARPPQARA